MDKDASFYLLATVLLEGKLGALALQGLGSDQALDLGGLAVLLAVLHMENGPETRPVRGTTRFQHQLHTSMETVST